MKYQPFSVELACFTLFTVIASVLWQCQPGSKNTLTVSNQENRKKGVLLVNHGSRSATWRKALLDLETNVRDSILQEGGISDVRTAFMEYTEPSIATRMKEFDAEGFTDIIIVPVFLTVSPHTFEDIPTIIGQKEDPLSLELIKIENIERYTPKARTYITPTLDFTHVLKQNVLRRVSALSQSPEKEGLVLIGYGDERYDKEWGQLFDNVADYVKSNLGITVHAYGWCGHIAHYDPMHTTHAINKVLKKKEKAVVIPVLVAHDEMFQVKIIGDGIANIKNSGDRVLYRPDAILPDPQVEKWVLQVCREYTVKIDNQVLSVR